MNQSKGKIIYALVAIIATFWGLSFLATSILVETIAPVQIQTMRWTIASVIFAGLVLGGRIRLSLRKPKAKYLLLTGLCEPCIYMLFETYGIQKTSSSMGSIFVATIPCMVLLIGTLFFHRKTGKMAIASIFLAFSGVAICTVFSPSFQVGGEKIGYLYLIGAVITAAFYAVASNQASQDYGALEITASMAFIGTVFFNLLNLFLGYGGSTYTVCFTNIRLLIGVLFLGVCCSAICYLSFNKVLSLIDPAVGNNMAASMTTVVGVVAGIFIAGDPGGWYTVVGLILTLAGVYLSSREV